MLLTVLLPATNAPNPPIERREEGPRQSSERGNAFGQNDRHLLAASDTTGRIDKHLHDRHSKDESHESAEHRFGGPRPGHVQVASFHSVQDGGQQRHNDENSSRQIQRLDLGGDVGAEDPDPLDRRGR